MVGLIGSAIISLGAKAFFPQGISIEFIDYGLFASFAIFAVVVYFAFKKVNPIYLILLSATLGIIVGYADKFLFA